MHIEIHILADIDKFFWQKLLEYAKDGFNRISSILQWNCRFCKNGKLLTFQLNDQALAYAVYKVLDIFENLFKLNYISIVTYKFMKYKINKKVGKYQIIFYENTDECRIPSEWYFSP